MSDERASADDGVRRLLSEVVDSFEKLEIAVYLFRARFGAKTTAEIAKTLSLAHDATAEALSELSSERIVRTTNQDGAGWWFDPNGPWASNVEQLVEAYDRDRFELLNLMTRMALDRVRKHAAQMFADAFVLKAAKKKKGEPDA